MFFLRKFGNLGEKYILRGFAEHVALQVLGSIILMNKAGFYNKRLLSSLNVLNVLKRINSPIQNKTFKGSFMFMS